MPPGCEKMASLLNILEFHIKTTKYFIFIWLTGRSFVGLKGNSVK